MQRRSTLDKNQALEQFLAGVEKKAFHLARLATGNEDDALEIVQDAMYKLVQRYARHDEMEWGPLFHRVLQSRIRDFYRRSKVRNRFRVWFGGDSEEHEEDMLEAQPDTTGNDPLQQLEADQFGVELEQAIRELPYRQQQAFLLRAWEGMDVKETARAMGCSIGSVKTHYSRAIKALRETLGDFDI
ncbi:MAG: RNA polymerase sigma factor [Gammaproteobacteria bacterium]